MNPHILSLASAQPPYEFDQKYILDFVRDHVLGSGWREHPEHAARAAQLSRDFSAAKVERRRTAVDVDTFYARPRTTGERMALFAEIAPPLAASALGAALGQPGAPREASDLTDLMVVSCTGYTAPGLDIMLARDMGMTTSIRRTVVGHMGCFGAMVGLRQALATARAYPDATIAMLCVEICSLHLTPTLDPEALTASALFGDGAAVALVGAPRAGETPAGPEIIGTYCGADFSAADQMSWIITDQGFVMSLSPRIPITLRRNIGSVLDGLLAPHDLRPSDITHWIVHPGGPSILTVIQRQLELSDDQMELSWRILREHGNCSSATVLLILEALVRSGRPQRGEWGVMMAFGPGLTLETCLLRF